LIDLYQKKLPNPDAELEDAIEDIDLDFIRDDLPKLLSSMTLGVERIRDISRSLRVFSRRDQERQSLFDIHSGLDSTLLILKHRTKALPNRPAIAIVKEYGDIPPINCFVGQLNQVFINILANAIDAFDAVNQHRSYAEIEANPNQITIRTIAIDAQHLQIEIQDNGSGMDAETQNRIFEQGFTTKLAGQGTGLGMAIAHQIITEKHNGTLTCTSELGRGTLFTITLPHTSQPQ
jgi:signal transduction histidine kinase